MQYSGAVVIKFLILTALSISYTDNYETVKYGVLQIELTSYHDNQQIFCNRVQIFNDFVLCAEILNFE
jgi:7-cyano-7-deazaguanine synthase in queuosine biosynthesis